MGPTDQIQARRREVVDVLASTLLELICSQPVKALNHLESHDIHLDSPQTQSVTVTQTAGIGLPDITQQEKHHGQ